MEDPPIALPSIAVEKAWYELYCLRFIALFSFNIVS
jgi:hypothetical protein